MADQSSKPAIDFEALLAARLSDQSLVEDDALERAGRLAVQEGKKLWHILPKLGLVGEARLSQEMANAFNLPLASASDFPDSPVAAERISPRFLREFKAALIGESDGVVQVAIADPDNAYAIKAIKQALGGPIRLHVGTPTEILAALDRWFGDGQSSMARIGDNAEGAHLGDDELEELRDHASEAPVVQLVNLIIERAIDLGASDIHLQPEGRTMSLRYRVDGVLMPAESPPPRMREAIISCIKLMGGLDIAERRLPQDGRVKLPVRGIPVDIRISAMPSLEGEGLVLRLLDRSNVELKLDALGFEEAAVDRVRHMVRQPNGIVLVTGPTGSGKTTTLYAILETINQSDRKILTVEDPVEYQIAGVLQTQVQPGINLGFAEVLRSSLRHDPDVIMVGEIRDLETAEIAVQASLTGHLVFSTLHTNGAPASVTRLVDMGIKPYLLGATMRGVISQRLVRRLCESCKGEIEISADRVGWVLDGERTSQKTFRVWRAVGCEACGQTGYKGRTVIYEIMDVSEAVQAAISRFDGEKDIAAAAAGTGFRPLALCGFDKVLAGITSVEEIMRVSLEA